MEERYMQVGDIEMCYKILGQGPPLIMIMGFTANMDMWGQTLIDRLAAVRTLVLFDNRGAGRTSSGTREFTVKRFADDTAMLLALSGIDRADVLGASMGGMIAQEFALDYPAMTDRLMLLCTTCGGVHASPPRPAALKPLIRRYPTPEEQLRQSMHVLYPPEWIRENPEAVEETIRSASAHPISPRNARRQMVAIARHHTYSRLPRIKNPALIMCGEQDVLIPPDNSRTLHRRIPGSRLRTFEKGGHGFPMQFPKDVAGELTGFLAGAS